MANNSALQATSAQAGSGRYRADLWINVTLPPLMKLWKGIGGVKKTSFFVSEEDARDARGAYEGSKPYRFAETLWRMAQVEADKTRGYRGKIMELVVDFPTEAAVGVCLANPTFGSGSVLQYFVPNWDRTLRPTGRTYRFDEKSY